MIMTRHVVDDALISATFSTLLGGPIIMTRPVVDDALISATFSTLPSMININLLLFKYNF